MVGFTMTTFPKLSIVAVSRNDNHGGSMKERMQLFLNNIFRQAEEYKFHIELIIVEWNPPSDRAGLFEIFDYSCQGSHCAVRIITVPNEVHSLYKHADKMPLYQMIGKNAGIKRAAGEFILATNVDVLFSDKMIEYLASADLQKDIIYRSDRYDVKNEILLLNDTHKIKKYCSENILRINKKTFTESFIENKIFINNNPFIECKRLRTKYQPYTNACGDFQLAHKDAWNNTRAYPELDMYSMNIDSLFQYLAAHCGYGEINISEEATDAVVYHIEHEMGYKQEEIKPIDDRITEKGIYFFNYFHLTYFAYKLKKIHESDRFNNEDWGFGTVEFNETQIKNKVANHLLVSTDYNKIKLSCDTDYWIKKLGRIFTELMPAYKFTFDKTKKIIIFGAGWYCRYIIHPLLQSCGKKASYIVDNAVSKQSQTINGLEIKKPDALLNENFFDILILLTPTYANEMIEQLNAMGFGEQHYLIVTSPFENEAIWDTI